jgi:vacuolar-type H+-ATPase subunit E/Vma4
MSEELLKGAKAEATRIENEGKDNGERILGEASGKRKKILEDAKAEAETLAANEKNEEIAAAHLEAKRIVSRAKEKAIENSMKGILAATADARDKDYKTLLKKLISEGIHEVGKDAVVMTNKEDKKLAHSLGFHVSDEPVNCIGGAVVSSPDGRVVFNNTFEARFEGRRERMRTSVHKILFGKEAKPERRGAAKGEG